MNATRHDTGYTGSAICTFVDGYDSVGNRTGSNHNGAVTTWVYL